MRIFGIGRRGKDFWSCGACGSLVAAEHWKNDGAPCPVCQRPGTRVDDADRIVRICQQCLDEGWSCSGTDLAEAILDEVSDA